MQTKTTSKIAWQWRTEFFFFPRRDSPIYCWLYRIEMKRVIAVQETKQQLRSFEIKILSIIFKVDRAQKYCEVYPSISSGDESVFLHSFVTARVVSIVAALHTE